MYSNDTFTNIVFFVAALLAYCTAIPVHEAAHAFVSDKLGDPTARRLGRITLNPLKHIDPWGLIAMIIVGIGWAKPVPIDTRYYKNRKAGMALSAAAGPASNIVLAYINMVLYKLVQYGFIYSCYAQEPYRFAMGSGGVLVYPMWCLAVLNILYYLVIINITLAVFNLLPIPPFDGSRIFLFFLPEKLYFQVMKYERFIMFGVLALVWLGVLNTPLSFLRNGLYDVIDFGTGYIDSAFNFFIDRLMNTMLV